MANESKIEWCDSTFNGWIGCTKVSSACDHCYAAVSTPARTLGVEWGAGNPRHRTSAANWRQPQQWNARPFWQCICGYRGDDEGGRHNCTLPLGAPKPARRRVFCSSLADWLDNEVPAEWLVDLLDLIRRTPNLDWLLLTKRIGNWRTRIQAAIFSKTYLSQELATWLGKWHDGNPPANVWIGATICNQAEADRDVPKLLRVPAAVRFLSIEPMLGEIDITEHLWGRAEPCADCPKDADCGCGWYPRGAVPDEPALNWVIVGGESGQRARPMHPDGPRSLRDQCAAAGVPFLFKQHGEWVSSGERAFGTIKAQEIRLLRPDWSVVDQNSAEALDENAPIVTMARVGKRAAGRLLDGVLHNGFPGAA